MPHTDIPDEPQQGKSNSLEFGGIKPSPSTDEVEQIYEGLKHYWLIQYAPKEADVEKAMTPAQAKAAIESYVASRELAARIDELENLQGQEMQLHESPAIKKRLADLKAERTALEEDNIKQGGNRE